MSFSTLFNSISNHCRQTLRPDIALRYYTNAKLLGSNQNNTLGKPKNISYTFVTMRLYPWQLFFYQDMKYVPEHTPVAVKSHQHINTKDVVSQDKLRLYYHFPDIKAVSCCTEKSATREQLTWPFHAISAH